MTLNTLEKMSKVLQVEPSEIFQFTTPQTDEEMFEYITKKIELLKNDSDKLRTVFSILKNIF